MAHLPFFPQGLLDFVIEGTLNIKPETFTNPQEKYWGHPGVRGTQFKSRLSSGLKSGLLEGQSLCSMKSDTLSSSHRWVIFDL
ncbi:hypothetical protein TNCV_1099731 [Trichonephila clavipes]|nr:hypothetical protein TNCV_1099731 [Trichonephila clavipes]